ncbi:MAG: DUF3472 domain-containing protein [Sphingobacteriales bacterium]
MRKLIIIYQLISCILLIDAKGFAADTLQIRRDIVIPLGGNAWVNTPAKIVDAGLVNWKEQHSICKIYFRGSVKQNLAIALRLRVPQGKSIIQIKVGNKTFIKQVANPAYDTVKVGCFFVKGPGYLMVELKGISKTGGVYADVSDLIIHAAKPDTGISYVTPGSSFHYSRRGPSVHLRYDIPKKFNMVRWFYNEVTVPVGMDIIGSYFQADGFGQGYFGMQVNSATERRILFSVWSPFSTDNPQSIPDSMRVKLIKKGGLTHIGEFGNEGSGGQSYMLYPWVAGRTYAFLLGSEPDAAGKSTLFTAYFKDISLNKWYLIASFKRPQTITGLTNLYSFVENFIPEQGDKTRMAFFNNQWIGDRNGNWQELTKAIFTGDATAKMKYRKDYGSGLNGDAFYLKNGGFFDKFTILNQTFARKANGNQPQISELPTK